MKLRNFTTRKTSSSSRKHNRVFNVVPMVCCHRHVTATTIKRRLAGTQVLRTLFSSCYERLMKSVDRVCFSNGSDTGLLKY